MSDAVQTVRTDGSQKKKWSAKKKTLVISLAVVGLLLALALSYVAYVFLSYHRIGDMELSVQDSTGKTAETGKEYKIVSWNIGFGAYEDDYGFFMDGGKESWAWSEKRLLANLDAILNRLSEETADLYLVQEVDSDATRTYHVDESKLFADRNGAMTKVYCQNYDSPFLLYPFTQPHGASQSGILTLSSFAVTSAKRFELPVETSVMKILDLDRCYSKSVIPVSDGKELVLYNFHLSAYTSDGTIATEQLVRILDDMQREYEKGNYCIAGGDFNKDLLGDSSSYFGVSVGDLSWANPIPDGILEKYDMTLIAPVDKDHPIPSCRNADGPYTKEQFVITIDGFLLSPNIRAVSSEVLDTQFRHSDHNPVVLRFELVEA